MPDIWLPFSRRELIGMKRCPDCGCHPATQGHKTECPTTLNQQEELSGA